MCLTVILNFLYSFLITEDKYLRVIILTVLPFMPRSGRHCQNIMVRVRWERRL